mmetsp:Transcript_32887/g.48006  ORF Transcript_32887/g.48006 Transcript_32887/m.48006 type:complete len:286 (+) Transcript_32887:216-1073(+)
MRRFHSDEAGVYEGDLVNSFRHGKGALTWPNGDTYKGDFQMGMRTGYGESIGKHGNTVYWGEFRNSERNGSGVENRQRNSSTYRYEGDWKDDTFHGIGHFKNSWSQYVGEFCNGYKEGFGFMLHRSGETYEGEWIYGKYSGWGKYIYVDESTYEGKWENGLKHGVGIMTSSDYQYDGHWHDGKRHGEGIHRNMWTGETRLGLWNDDTFIKWTELTSIFGTTSSYTHGLRPDYFDCKREKMPMIEKLKELSEYQASFRWRHRQSSTSDISSAPFKVKKSMYELKLI